MDEANILEQTRKLVDLQSVDEEIYSLKRLLKEKPVYLAELSERFESKKSKLNQLEEQYKALQLERKGFEGDLQSQDDGIAKANAQLSQIKTNKEYTAKITEIESLESEKSKTEEKILISYDHGDEKKILIDKEKEALGKEEEVYKKEKAQIETSIKEMEARIKVLESQRDSKTEGVPKDILDRYNKILKNKQGLAIVPIQGTSCGGCYMNIPAQVVNEIKMHEELIFCEVCARIIYLQEDI